MDVERLIRRLNGRQDAVENGRVAAVVTAELFAECAAALAKLQADNKAWEVALNSERELWNTISDQLEASVAKLQAENERLNQCLRYEQHREGRIGTHSPNCHTWGPQHYECAIAKLEVAEAERDEAREALRPVNGDDGGWLFVKSLFVPRTVTRLSVPGAGPDGMHRIEVELSDGSSVMVTGVNHQAAWQSLADAAAAGRALGGGE